MSDPRPIVPLDRPPADRAAGAAPQDATEAAPPTLLMLAADDAVLCLDDTCLPPGDEA
jgi:hypothetical protein